MHRRSNLRIFASRTATALPATAAVTLFLACQLPGSGDDGHAESNASSAETESRGVARNPDGTERNVTPKDVLQSISRQVVVPAVLAFGDAARALHVATMAHTAAQGTADAATKRVEAQVAFQAAMLAWQHLELMQIGPAGASGTAIAGEGVRDEIYSWPTSNPCRLDLKLSQAAEPAEDYFEANAVDSYGLDAIEYLLFTASADHACPDDVGLDPTWSAIGPAELERRRSRYAQAMSAEVVRLADVLATRWLPQAEDFGSKLASPGSGDSPYVDEAQALDAVFAAMFYADKFTKDAKIGRTLGIIPGCAAVPCADLLELPHSDDALLGLTENLRALEAMLLGGPTPALGHGFDDLLRQAGYPEIADNLLAAIADAVALLEGTTSPLSLVVVQDPTRAQAIYDAIKRVTDELKGPFVMALRLKIPAEGAGDND